MPKNSLPLIEVDSNVYFNDLGTKKIHYWSCDEEEGVSDRAEDNWENIEALLRELYLPDLAE